MPYHTDTTIGNLILLQLINLTGSEIIPFENSDDTYGATLSVIKAWISQNIDHKDLKSLLGDGPEYSHLSAGQLQFLKRFSVSDSGQLLFDSNVIGQDIPLSFKNKVSDFNQSFPLNSYVDRICIFPILGVTSIKIGLSDGGEEILPLFSVEDFTQIKVEKYLSSSQIFYFKISNGTVNIRIDYKLNFDQSK